MSNRNNHKDKWLLDAEVKYRIEKKSGRWEVSLIFIDVKDPKHFLVQKIGDYHSERLAKIYALNFQQTAAKDARGTQKVDRDAYNLDNN